MRTITVVQYDKRWPDIFLLDRSLIQGALGEIAKNIYHIGSTSVPDLAAKPVIDILLEVSGLNELDKLEPAMAGIGYVARGENGIPGRRYFIKGGDRRSHQVHAFIAGDTQIIRHLAFRDYLIKNKEVAKEYAAIKHAAAVISQNDVPRYSTLKADFIRHHVQLALIDMK
ncbi:GrpB family protein [Erwinia sp. BNK-24-b]|uniref:GrpB family protein n=1 Tax=unclassified Erwinia TaxID=2622719 RepID=UPI0039BFF788